MKLKLLICDRNFYRNKQIMKISKITNQDIFVLYKSIKKYIVKFKYICQTPIMPQDEIIYH